VNQGLHGTYKDILTTYWQHVINHLENETHDYKLHQLPLARIKKVMKADPEVKMISAEAPILFAKGCDIFITELTMRAWIHAEENKRRTLQRSDIASALSKSDMFDFLIDIVPREEVNPKRPAQTAGVPPGSALPQQGMAPPGQMAPPAGPDYSGMGHGGLPYGDGRAPQSIYDQGQGGYAPGAQMYPSNMDAIYGYPDMNNQQVCSSRSCSPHIPLLQNPSCTRDYYYYEVLSLISISRWMKSNARPLFSETIVYASSVTAAAEATGSECWCWD
jgi:nuclear transcription factor Y gamma